MRGFNPRERVFANTREEFFRLDANRRYMIDNYDNYDILLLTDFNASLNDFNNRMERILYSNNNMIQSPVTTPIYPTNLINYTSTPINMINNIPVGNSNTTTRTHNMNGVEMVTTISTTSPGSLPNSLLDVIQNIVNVTMPSMLVNIPVPQDDVVVSLPQDCIKQMPSKKVKHTENMEPCSICFNDFNKGERYRKLPCNHQFHKRCIDKWFNESVKCPMCRQDIRDLLQQHEK